MLPDALLQIIFTLVVNPTALARCSLVCKDWHRVLSSVAFWKHISHKICTLANSLQRYGDFVVQLMYGGDSRSRQFFNIPLIEKSRDAAEMSWVIPVPDGWYTFMRNYENGIDLLVMKFGAVDALSNRLIIVGETEEEVYNMDGEGAEEEDDVTVGGIGGICTPIGGICTFEECRGFDEFHIRLSCDDDKHLMTVRVRHQKDLFDGATDNRPAQAETHYMPIKSAVRELANKWRPDSECVPPHPY